MKTLLILLTLLTTSASAQVRCYDDGFGNLICRSTDGYRTKSYDSGFGYSQSEDNEGNTWTCYESFGETICD